MIAAKNRRHIFYLCNKLGIGQDTRRTIQESVTGKDSLKELNDAEASELIKALKGELRKQSVKRGTWKNRLGHGENVYNLMTPDQMKKITAMSLQIYGKFDEGRMNSFCFRQFKKSFRRLTSGEAASLIEIQKSMLKRKIGGTV